MAKGELIKRTHFVRHKKNKKWKKNEKNIEQISNGHFVHLLSSSCFPSPSNNFHFNSLSFQHRGIVKTATPRAGHEEQEELVSL